MQLLECFKTGDYICITPNSYKKKILKKLNTFYHVHFYTLEEVKKQIFYEYQPETLYRFCSQFGDIPANAKIVLDALYAVSDKTFFPDLYEKKQWLLKENLLVTHPFLEHFSFKKIVVYGYEPYEMKLVASMLNHVEYSEEEFCYLPSITEYETLEEEVVCVAEQISKLIASGVSINHIFLGPLSSDYQSVVFKIFHQFHIPYQKRNSHVLYEYEMVQMFLSIIDWSKPLCEASTFLKSLEQKYPITHPFYQKIYEMLTVILNSYYDENRLFSDIREIFLYDLKNKTVPEEVYENVVREVDFKNTLFEEDDYVFVIGVNLGEIPKIYEDQDYFTDAEKRQLSLPTSLEMMIGEEEKYRKKIQSTAHVFLSYKKNSPFKEYLPSPLIDYFKEKKVEVKKGSYEYTNQYYNEYLLNASLDDFINFNIKNEPLLKLYGTETIFYQSYDNQFTGIKPTIFQKYVPFCLLSYTGMQKFFECPFKYYVQSILKINPPFKETPSLIVGNLFHTILERYFKKEDLETVISEELEKVSIKPSQKRQFYLEKYQKEIRRLIDIIEKQQSLSSFVPSYFEEEIGWLEHKQITFKIFGKIDKIMTFDDGENAYVIVIDYKTGAWANDLSKVVYGMNMQLLLYLYLLSKDERFQKFELGGAYIQSILPSIPTYKEGMTLEEQWIEQSKLDGVMLKRNEFISALDHEFDISSYIKGIRIKKDGDFWTSPRLMEANTLQSLLEIVKKNIDKVEEEIEKAQFLINPKKFESEEENKISSCAYCSYSDICYLKAKNVVRLKEYKNLEFLGGDDI